MRVVMRLNRFSLSLLPIFLAACIPAAAQLSPAEPDPLARIRDAAKSNVQACSATAETLCEQVAPKIIENAMGESPLAENLRRFSKETKGHKTWDSKEAAVIAWAVAAFRSAGMDAHVEKYASHNGGPAEQETVVAEIRGRENPDNWVLLGARLGPHAHDPGAVDYSCDAAAVIEAARDIQLTGVHPRQSIRFVLFTRDSRGVPSSWAYVRSHRSELDHARAAIVIRSDCSRVNEYLLNGRPAMEPGVREALKPIDSFGANHFDFRPLLEADNFDFLLEGVPALTAFPLLTTISIDSPAPIRESANIADVKRNTAIAAVTAFGIAERAEPLGPRQSRAEIETLLKTSGLELQMKTAGLWPLWESGQRGRLP
jgi:hypothetical protein